MTLGKIRQYQMHLFPPLKSATPFLSPSRFSTYQTQHYAQTRRFNTLLANQTDRPKLRPNLLGRFTLVRVVLHGLRGGPVANRRLGGEAARRGGICHLLGEYTVARPSRSQS